MALVKSEGKISKSEGKALSRISFVERITIERISKEGIERTEKELNYELNEDDLLKSPFELFPRLSVSNSFRSNDCLKDKIKYISYYLINRRDVVFGLIEFRKRKLIEISKGIKEIGCVLHIDNCSYPLLETMKRMVESSLAFGKRVIVNSFCYNLGTKSVKQQFNFEKESAKDLDLFLVDPNFEKDEQRIQIYDFKKYRLEEDKDFRIELEDMMSGETLSLNLIKKYYNKELNWTVFTVPARVYENSNLYRLKRDLYLDRHHNLKVITFSDFL